MEKRKIGNSGLEVAPLAFGGNVFGWTVDESTSFKLLDAFVDAGFNLVDTADVYSRWVEGHSGGESETIIGKWLKRSGNRPKVVLATKVGKEMGPNRQGLSTAYILQAVEDSLRRLQTDYIDLYQSHAEDPDTPLEETREAYAQLIRQGKVRDIGASNYSAQRLAEALAVSERCGGPRYKCILPTHSTYPKRSIGLRSPHRLFWGESLPRVISLECGSIDLQELPQWEQTRRIHYFPFSPTSTDGNRVRSVCGINLAALKRFINS
jgi:aryl-alcohol dehydrogenase-like predicted oxidoreductase